MSIFHNYFNNSGKVLSSLYEKSKTLEHKGLKGSIREDFISGFLKEVFPKKYDIGKGIIVDSDNKRSKEADILIYADNCPVLYYGQYNHYLSGGVYGHIEVKTNLFKGHLLSALKVVTSIKNLKRDIITGGWLGDETNLYFGDKTIETVPSYIFAYDGPKFSTLQENINQYYRNITNIDMKFDGICVLNKYAIIKKYTNEQKQMREFYYYIGKDSLMIFFLSLYFNVTTYYHSSIGLLNYFDEPVFHTF